MAHRNVAAHRAKELRARLGYLISPEQERALNDIDAVLTAQLGELSAAHALVRSAWQGARAAQNDPAVVWATLIKTEE